MHHTELEGIDLAIQQIASSRSLAKAFRPPDLWGLNSLTRDQTLTLCVRSPVVLDKSLTESQTSRDNKSCMSYTSKQKYPSKIRTRDPTIGDFFLFRGCSKPYTNQCPKPTRQHISHFAQQPGLQKDVVPVPFCNHCQKGKRLSSDYFQPEDFDTAGSAFSGGAAPVPLTPGPHFGTPGYRGPHVTTLYPYIPVPEDHAGPSLRNESKLLIDDY
ncbi:hypothetical protein MJG53_001832 [Ovis ammon polii x Ovis aries]|uniref:Uncharacterized protein n=1 Tax=Ovis ammon polii x Ovis aries TaxID=2918886 RepID=A0ACB9VME9_9CETA|nr:hypothetical protein MJG53_001832 [Ovis ammon polii x Ovis aries]